MPANDATPNVWYALWRPLAEGLRIEHRALHYDAGAARAAMHAAGLRNGYADALVDGLWPSLDVLPSTERARTGVPLAEFSVRLPRV